MGLTKPFAFMAGASAEAGFDPTLGGAISPAHWYDFTDDSTMTLDGSNKINIISSKGTLTPAEISSRYYLRGFQAIEKEIEIISSRTDIKPFVEELGRLEEKKRDLMSDRSIDRLENVISNSTPRCYLILN